MNIDLTAKPKTTIVGLLVLSIIAGTMFVWAVVDMIDQRTANLKVPAEYITYAAPYLPGDSVQGAVPANELIVASADDSRNRDSSENRRQWFRDLRVLWQGFRDLSQNE